MYRNSCVYKIRKTTSEFILNNDAEGLASYLSTIPENNRNQIFSERIDYLKLIIYTTKMSEALLLSCPANNSFFMQAFYMAIKADNLELVSLFLRLPNTQINATFSDSYSLYTYTPLMWAVVNKRPNIVREIVKHPDINVNNSGIKHKLPILLALKNTDHSENDLDTLRALVTGQGFKQTLHPEHNKHYRKRGVLSYVLEEFGEAKFFILYESNRFDCEYKYLPNEPVPIQVAAAMNRLNVLNYFTTLPLFNATTRYSNGNTLLHNSERGCLKYLMQIPGIDINATNKSGRSPLCEALASREDIWSAEILLMAGADVKIDVYGKTALHYAARLDYVKHLVKLLIEHGADINTVDKEGLTPLSVTLLKCQGFNGNKYTNYFYQCFRDLAISLLSAPNINIYIHHQTGQESYLNSAIIINDPVLIQALLDLKAVENERSHEISTGLLLAANTGNLKVVELFVRYAEDINYREDKLKETACIKAAKYLQNNPKDSQALACLVHLVYAGADLKLKDVTGNTALAYTPTEFRSLIQSLTPKKQIKNLNKCLHTLANTKQLAAKSGDQVNQTDTTEANAAVYHSMQRFVDAYARGTVTFFRNLQNLAPKLEDPSSLNRIPFEFALLVSVLYSDKKMQNWAHHILQMAAVLDDADAKRIVGSFRPAHS